MPNLNPPESRRPCFFDIDPSRRIVFDVNPDSRGDDGAGTSEAVDRCSDDLDSDLVSTLETVCEVSPNAPHPSASQPRLTARVTGKADTGRSFRRRRGVVSIPSSDSASASASLRRSSAALYDAECCNGAPRGRIGGTSLYGDPGAGEGRWKPRENELDVCRTGGGGAARLGDPNSGLDRVGELLNFGVYAEGGVRLDPSLRFDNELVDRLNIDDNAAAGPDRFEEEADVPDICDKTEMSEVPDAAEVERRLAGRGGTGGWCVLALVGDLLPTDELRLRLGPSASSKSSECQRRT